MRSNRVVGTSILVFLCSSLATVAGGLAQTPAKKIVRTQADLPRFNYPVSGTATQLLTSDDATFGVFAAKVGADVDSVLRDYDIEDHATMRGLLWVRVELELLASDEDKAALQTVNQIRDLEDKPDSKLLSMLWFRAMIEAHAATGQTSGPAYEEAYAKKLAESMEPLPWATVANQVKQEKSGDEMFTRDVMLGTVKAGIEPAVAKSHQLGNDLAWQLIDQRFYLVKFLPLVKADLAVLTKYVAEHNVERPDIWEAREVTLTAADKLTPVRVAIWDSGSDLVLFPGRVYTDPHPASAEDAHDVAFDLKGFPTHGYLYPLNAQGKQEYPGMRTVIKGYSDLEASIDSPEAAAVKKKLAGLSPSEVRGYMEQVHFFDMYVHGTHVAGIAARGNPAIRLAVARVTFDWHYVPLPPNEELSRRSAADNQAYVDWLRRNGIRVVNMSWGGGPQGYETALEKNGMGKNAAERKEIAAKLFAIDRDGLYNALKSAPEILFVCSAGNSDNNTGFNEMIPASFNLPNLLAVGAVDQAGDEASFTSYGSTVLVDADGYQVESVVPGGDKIRLTGTSMASPNVVNLAAKLIALDPKLTPEETIHLIVAGATASEDGRRHNINPKRSVEMLHQMASTK